MSLVVFLLAFGLSLRLTRLVVEDSITNPIRDYLAHRAIPTSPEGNKSRISRKTAEWFWTLLTCPWCVGVYASAFSFSWAYLATSGTLSLTFFTYAAAAASASYLIGVAVIITTWLNGE